MKLWERNNHVYPWERASRAFLTTGVHYRHIRGAGGYTQLYGATFWQVMIPTPVYDWDFSLERMSWVMGFKWLTIRRWHGRTDKSFSVLNVRHEVSL
jgi:hypothetical protein